MATPQTQNEVHIAHVQYANVALPQGELNPDLTFQLSSAIGETLVWEMAGIGYTLPHNMSYTGEDVERLVVC